MTKRAGTHMGDDERAAIGAAHRAAAPRQYDGEDVTGQYEGEDLERARLERARRFPAASIVALERKQDALEKEVRGIGKEVSETRVDVAEIRGDQKTAAVSLASIAKTLERAEKREHLTFAARVDVDKAEKIDAIDAKKAKRNLYLKVVGAIVAGSAVAGAVGSGVVKLLQLLGLR